MVDRQTGEILDKTLALNLIIRDKNDNPPVFKPEILNIDIPENTKEGENHTLMFVKQIGSTSLVENKGFPYQKGFLFRKLL